MKITIIHWEICSIHTKSTHTHTHVYAERRRYRQLARDDRAGEEGVRKEEGEEDRKDGKRKEGTTERRVQTVHLLSNRCSQGCKSTGDTPRP